TPRDLHSFPTRRSSDLRERGRAKIARGIEEIAELDRAVAFDARDGGAAREIVVGEAIDDLLAESILIIKNIVWDINLSRDLARRSEEHTSELQSLAYLV